MKTQELKCSISADELKIIKKDILECLAINRHTLIIQFPFIGNMSTRFDLIPVRDKRCRTACTDGKTIYFDCDFYKKLTDNERIFVLAHEIWHNVMLHFARRQTRQTELFNIATDMEVNNILVEDSGNILTPPADVFFPPDKLKGKSAEEIYDWLLKQQKQNKLASVFENSSKVDSNNKNNSSNQISKQFDKHIYSEDSKDSENSEDADTSITDQWGEVGYDDDFKPQISPEIAEKIREMVISTTQQIQRQCGNLPSCLESYLDKLKRPEINWKDELCNFVTTCYGGNRQWLPPNRRHVYNDTYFQSRRHEAIRGIVCIDTSGSCIGDLPKFFGELKGLIETFGSYELTVICADAAVDQVDVYDDCTNPLELETAKDIKWTGGGGTDYGPCFQYIEDEGLTPDFVVYIGDGYANMSYNKKPTYPVLWLITKDGSFDFCDWGKKIRFKESSFE